VGRIARSIPPHARVMGHTMLYMGLYDRDFVSSIPPYFSDWRSVEDAAAHIERHRPDYFVQTSLVYGSVGGLAERPRDLRTTTCGKGIEQVVRRVPAHVLDEFYDRDFGAVRIWRLDWTAVPAAACPASRPSTQPSHPGAASAGQSGQCFCCHRQRLRDAREREMR
jgi:hypothetical protein